MLFSKALALLAAAVSANALSSTLKQMANNFGPNPTNVEMFSYTVNGHFHQSSVSCF